MYIGQRNRCQAKNLIISASSPTPNGREIFTPFRDPCQLDILSQRNLGVKKGRTIGRLFALIISTRGSSRLAVKKLYNLQLCIVVVKTNNHATRSNHMAVAVPRYTEHGNRFLLVLFPCCPRTV